jgi:1-acyl-sn-glycerol-3-phosphate acyltransferase
MTNHLNFLEPFIDMQAIPGWVVAIEKKENFKLPIYGLLIKAWGNISIDRENPTAARESLERADSGTLLEAAGDLLHTGPTLTNVGDLVLALGS